MNSRFLFYVVIILAMGAFTHAEAGGHGGGGFGGKGFGGGGFRSRSFVGRGFGDRNFRHGGLFPNFVVGVDDPYYYPDYYPYYDYSPVPVSYPVGYDSRSPIHESLTIQVQRMLSRQGYYRGDIDGIIGPQTHSAIAAYQQKHGLDQNGIIDASLLKSLKL